MRVLIVFSAVLTLSASTTGFQRTFVRSATQTAIHSRKTKPNTSTMSLYSAIPRGGDIIAVAASALTSGPFGVVSLWGIASSVIVPLTLYRQGYSFTVGYGLSVMAMGLAILNIVQPTAPIPLTMVAATIFYGFRLGAFLFLREMMVPSKAAQIKAFNKSPPLQRIPLALSVAMFYSFLTLPVLYACRKGATLLVGVPRILSMVGATIAVMGAMLEAVADTHKFLVKKRGNNEGAFVGPTGGVYRISRHPNYLGEVVFWAGLLIGGAPSLGVVAWLASLCGLYGIYGIMTNATKRLDKSQAETYKGQERYESWRSSVKAPLFPFIE